MTAPGVELRGYCITDTALYQLVLLARMHRNELAKELMKLGLYIGQEQVLLHMWEPDGVSQAELGVRLQAVPPTLTKMLQRMERAGLVRRERDAGRGRASWVFLTDQGCELRDKVKQLWQRAEDRLTVALSCGERGELQRLLKKLVNPEPGAAPGLDPAAGLTEKT